MRKMNNNNVTEIYRSSKTLPSSPTHSFSSSSDFEFRVSLSPRKSSAALIPADELFYKGQLLPLHLSPRNSMVRSLLVASSSTSSSEGGTTATTASRDSSSSVDSTSSSFAADLSLLAAGDPFCDSSRPSSVTDDDHHHLNRLTSKKSPFKYFSLPRLSGVFRNDPPPAKKMSASAKEVIKKYLKKVKPLYEKISQKQQQGRCGGGGGGRGLVAGVGAERSNGGGRGFCQSFSGNLKGRSRRSYVASCPSSMGSSPNHSGVLCRVRCSGWVGQTNDSDRSTMDELQNAIQGAIAHCKNSMLHNNNDNKAIKI